MNSNWHGGRTPTSTTVDTAHKNAPANDSFARIRFPFMVVEVVIALEVAARRRARRWPGSWSMWRYRLRWTLQWSHLLPPFSVWCSLVGGTSGARRWAPAPLGGCGSTLSTWREIRTAKPRGRRASRTSKRSGSPEEEALGLALAEVLGPVGMKMTARPPMIGPITVATPPMTRPVTRVIESVSVKDASARGSPGTSQRRASHPGERGGNPKHEHLGPRGSRDSRRRRLAVTDGLHGEPGSALVMLAQTTSTRASRNAAIQ